MNKKIFIYIVFFFSCSSVEKTDEVVLARVGTQRLLVKDLPKDLKTPPLNKKKIAFFIKKWVNNSLLFGAARKEGLLKDKTLIKERDFFYKKLVISTFLETMALSNFNISKEEVLNHYKKNKDSFVRKKESLFVRFFISSSLFEAKKTKKRLIGNKEKPKPDLFFSDSKYIEKGYFIPKIDNILFKTKGVFVGPVETEKGFYVFEVISRHEKGSLFGLEEVHDEIYQRLVKKKTSVRSSFLLDSLKENSSFFINPNY